MKYIESKTAVKHSWGSDPYRRVTHLTPTERAVVRNHTATVWFRIRPWHPSQSGIKIVVFNGRGFDSREPTPAESNAIRFDKRIA